MKRYAKRFGTAKAFADFLNGKHSVRVVEISKNSYGYYLIYEE